MAAPNGANLFPTMSLINPVQAPEFFMDNLNQLIELINLQVAPQAQTLSLGGTVTANGTSAVTVVAPQVTANSQINLTLKTVGGTPAGAPYLATITPGTGFTIKSAAGDTSVYNYAILG